MINLSDIFIKNYPTLDLHGLTRDIARVLTIDFINDNHFLGKEKIVIIHGIGCGIIKEVVHTELKNNQKVTSFRLEPFNAGLTIVTLNINEN